MFVPNTGIYGIEENEQWSTEIDGVAGPVNSSPLPQLHTAANLGLGCSPSFSTRPTRAQASRV